MNSTANPQDMLHLYSAFPPSAASGGMGGEIGSSIMPLSHHQQHAHPSINTSSNHSTNVKVDAHAHGKTQVPNYSTSNSQNDDDDNDSMSSDNSDSNNGTSVITNNIINSNSNINMGAINAVHPTEAKLYSMPSQSLQMGRSESMDSVSKTVKRSARVRHQDETIPSTMRAETVSAEPEDNDGDPSARKRRRNTEAARRSRLKKMQKIETLDATVMILQRDRKDLEVKVAVLENEKLTLLARQKDLMDRVTTLEQHLHEAHQAMLKMNSMKGDTRH
ncbi:hypothetical protein CcCBS67573_g07335 [Chytriomyces confervae]|uniref:BZIP domain-containing protein n=1 Tax=Chytriomyces confervae TaxID=246404 RepID=A0A507EX92_9FUNG|nr:hypothetical protein HDU80_003841 [Chytriomyces hyalinus]TPX67990.1 hypothetical protein CcCBS67573_g07335 [Chytriomyces confervae]